jgi:hypothetical protein
MTRQRKLRQLLLSRGVLAEAFFAVWMALTIVHQSRSARRFTGVVDPLGFFLPVWTFFGPIPGTLDSEILYRHVLDDGQETRWTPLPIYEDRRFSHLLVHFNRRKEKVVFDAVSVVLELIREGKPDDYIITSSSYIVLLGALISSTPAPAPASFIQFMVVNSSSADENPSGMVPVFVSAKHRIDGRHGSQG